MKKFILGLTLLTSVSAFAADELKCTYDISHTTLITGSLENDLDEKGEFKITGDTWPRFQLELKGKHSNKGFKFEYSSDASMATVQLTDEYSSIMAFSQTNVDFGQEYKLKGAKIFVTFIGGSSYINVVCE